MKLLQCPCCATEVEPQLVLTIWQLNDPSSTLHVMTANGSVEAPKPVYCWRVCKFDRRVHVLEEAEAARSISQRGVMLVATAHGTDLRSIMGNPDLNSLVGGMQTVILGDAAAGAAHGGAKTRTERRGEPTFRCLVEVQGRGMFLFFDNSKLPVAHMHVEVYARREHLRKRARLSRRPPPAFGGGTGPTATNAAATVAPARHSHGIDRFTTGGSLLLLGRPGAGKTTLLRDIARFLADDLGLSVVVVDTSNEIAGGDTVPHSCIGSARRLKVGRRDQLQAVMLEAVQNHGPQVVVVDELGSRQEAEAARSISQRGVMLVATAHGTDLRSIMGNPDLNSLVGGMQTVILGDAAAGAAHGGAKTRTERRGEPTFRCLVEVQGRGL
eukprot:XP_001691436.1 predicted protein [Chlamydomonas reinhardtii]